MYVNGPEKTGLIYIKYTCSYYSTYVCPILYISTYMYVLFKICKFYWISYGMLHIRVKTGSASMNGIVMQVRLRSAPDLTQFN